MTLTRRHMLAASASMVGVANIPVASFGAPGVALTPTESIGSIPEYVLGAPRRTSFLRPGLTSQRIKLVGRALTTNGEPLTDARLNFWHTDGDGAYDYGSYDFRGSQITGTQGGFLLETVMPGPYAGPSHIHFLLEKRLNGRAQPSMLSGVIYFPTAEEFADASASERVPEVLNLDKFPTIDGVLMTKCDIVMETA